MTKSVDDTRDFIRSCLKDYAENKSITTFILYRGEIVGTSGYNKIDWSTDYAFNELKLNRVDIRAAVDNKKSRSIPERLGFVNEGRIRQAEWLYDHYVDHIVYGMLAEDWIKS